MQIEVNLESKHPELIFSGRMSMGLEEEAELAYQRIRQKGDRFVVVLREDAIFDSSGLAILLGVVTRAQKEGLRLALFVPAERTRQLLSMMAVQQYVAICATEAAAAEAIQ